MSAVQIFNLLQVVMLGTSSGVATLNFPLNRTDIKIFRGVANTITVLIRDVDRQPSVFATGIVPSVTIIHKLSKSVLWSGSLTLLDASQSMWSFTIQANDISDWDNGFCTYTVTTTDTTGNVFPLFTDRDYSIQGPIEIVDGPYPDSPKATVILPSACLTRDAIPIGGSYPQSALYSPSYPGAAQTRNLSALGALAVYSTNFTGSIRIQGLLDTAPSQDDSQWLAVKTVNLNQASGISYSDFEGNYYWIRIVIQSSLGSVEQVLMRS